MSSGFQYKVEIRTSAARGRGIYAMEFIPKSQLVWTLTPNNHLSFSEEELIAYIRDLPIEKKKDILNHIYVWGNRAILCTDDAELVNHSSNPNLCESPHDNRMGCWSVNNIYPGDELLDSYKTYETPDWYIRLCAEYEVESSRDVAEKYY